MVGITFAIAEFNILLMIKFPDAAIERNTHENDWVWTVMYENSHAISLACVITAPVTFQVLHYILLHCVESGSTRPDETVMQLVEDVGIQDAADAIFKAEVDTEVLSLLTKEDVLQNF